MNREIQTLDSYSAKLLKLIPAEVSAAYLSINSLVPLSVVMKDPLMIGSVLVLTVLCPIYLYASAVRNWWQLAFTTISFPVWAVNISSARILEIPSFYLGVALIILTLLIPLIPAKK